LPAYFNDMADLDTVKGVHFSKLIAANEIAESGFRLSGPRIRP